MDILKDNFAEMLPMVKESIDDCDFLAIDTELTGLSTKVTEHSFDTIAERYSKYKENCMRFIIIQFGLSTFKYLPKQNKYTHKDFNFFVFPRPHMRQAPDPKFMCQTSSLHFLASHGFDFNKIIYEGIQYLSPSQEEKIRQILESRHKSAIDSLKNSKNGTKTNGQKEVDVPEEHKEFLARVHERVEAFICNDDEKTIELDPCSSYRRKLIYETVQQKHQTGIEMSSAMNKDNKRVINIVKTTDEEKHEQLHMKQITDFGDLDTAIGFRKVMDHISNSKKLIIGHNMLLDLMHIVDQFFLSLPENLSDFKDIINHLFPQIMDTKTLSSSEKLKQFFESTHLGEVVKTLQGKAFNMPAVEPADGFKGYDLNTDKAHQAGYDAFLSGFSYIGLVHKLASLENCSVGSHDVNSKLLKSYANRIFIMRHYDIGTLNICSSDPEPNRDNVFYVSFPQEWKTIDLVELFLPYGNIYVNWLDDVSALVALKNRDHIINARTNLLNKPSKLYTVRSFEEYQRAMNKRNAARKKSTDVKKTQTFSEESSGKKRRASGSAETMELIPETDENEAENADDPVSTSHESNESKSSIKSKASSSGSPSSKRQKRYHEENEAEVSSTAKVFEEENTW